MSVKKKIKKVERKFFDFLKFDTLGYTYVKPDETDPSQLRRLLIDDYFKNQPSVVSVVIVCSYLFLKKALLFVLRRVKRILR
jgi:hypothetical protein